MLHQSNLARFMSKVEPVTESGCWLWLGSLFKRSQRGQFHVVMDGRQRNLQAHRVSWMLHKGDIPDNLCILHRCDVPSCVNPAHLFLGTIAENNADRAKKGRSFRPRGTKKTTARLNDAKALYLRSLPRLTIEHAKELAKLWGFTKETSYKNFYRVRNGKRWKTAEGGWDGSITKHNRHHDPVVIEIEL